MLACYYYEALLNCAWATESDLVIAMISAWPIRMRWILNGKHKWRYWSIISVLITLLFYTRINELWP